VKLSSSAVSKILLVGGLLLIAINLRPSITAVAPLAERLQEEGVGRQVVGLMTTVPLILFSVIGLWSGWLGGRIGFARALGLGLFLLGIGSLIRSGHRGEIASLAWLMPGTLLIGAGIAIGNVLLPGVVKRRFPDQVGLLTSLYSTAINLGAGLGIGLAVPIANRFSGGTSTGLAVWGGLGLISLLIWMPEMLKPPAAHARARPLAGVWAMAKRRRAWQVAAHMGLTSAVFYSAVAWLPTVLLTRGMTESSAGWWVATMQVIGCFASLTVPTLAARARSQSAWAAMCGLTTALSLIGILFLPLSLTGAAVLALGLGLNGQFGMALLLIALRSRDADTAAGMSSMAQSFGYLFAAPGPWFIGWLSGATARWDIAFGVVAAGAALTALAGVFAGREGTCHLSATKCSEATRRKCQQS